VPIYEQTYRRYEAREPLRAVRFWPITREALRIILARRAFLGLLAIAWLPFVIRVGQIYLFTRFPEAGRILPVDGRLFGVFLNQQIVFTLLLSIFGGAGLIANDLRTGAILVYLSRPLTRRDYVLGKLGVLLGLNLSVTLVPDLLLYAIAIALAPEQFLKWSLAWIGPAILLHSIEMTLFVSLLALAISSLSRSARVAGLGFFGLVFGLELVQGILAQGFSLRPVALLSPWADFRALCAALFGLAERGPTLPWPWPAAVLLVVGLLCLVMLRSRVRAVEIVR
jgi:ABC-2 type transport system permease protein